jgi:hypothetical protein
MLGQKSQNAKRGRLASKLDPFILLGRAICQAGRNFENKRFFKIYDILKKYRNILCRCHWWPTTSRQRMVVAWWTGLKFRQPVFWKIDKIGNWYGLVLSVHQKSVN